MPPSSSPPIEHGRVYISRDKPRANRRGQYFDGVPPEIWEFRIGGYQPLDKWLKDRRGRTLSFDDIEHYRRMVVVAGETMRLMAEVDEAISEAAGGLFKV